MGSALVATGQAIEIIAITLGIYLTIGLAVSAFMNWYNARHRAGDAMSAARPPLPGWLATLRQRLFATPVDIVVSLALRLRRVAHIAAAGRLAAGRRQLARHHARGLHQRRRLLGVHPRPLRPVHVRPVSACPSAGASILLGALAVCAAAALSWRRLPRRRAAAIAALHRPAAARHLAALWRLRPAHRRDARMGRADADALHLDLCRPDRDPARHPAGARPPLAPADDPLRSRSCSSSSGAACRSSP